MDRFFLRARGASNTVDQDCEPLLTGSDGMHRAFLFMAVLGTYSGFA